MKIKLEFKKEDFNNPYDDNKHCAITTALHRAGYTDLVDCGIDIETTSGQIVVTESNPTYSSLVNKVVRMYGYEDAGPKLKPKDFTHTLDITEELWKDF